MGKTVGLVLVGLIALGCGSSNPPDAGSGSGGSSGSSGTGGTGGGGTGGAGTGGTAGVAGVGGSCPTGVMFNPGTGDGRNMVPASGLCQRLAEIQCAAERCCCPEGNARKYESEAACITSQVNICRTIGTQDIAEDPRAGFDPDAIVGAFNEFERLASSCDLGIVNWGTSLAGFASVIRGTVGAGGECWTPVGFPPEANPAGAVASCGNSAACQGSAIAATPWTCGPRLNEGGRCLADPSCADGLFCADPPVPPGNVTLGTCTTRKPTSEPPTACSRATECQSLFCVGGLCVGPSVEAAYCLKP